MPYSNSQGHQTKNNPNLPKSAACHSLVNPAFAFIPDLAIFHNSLFPQDVLNTIDLTVAGKLAIIYLMGILAMSQSGMSLDKEGRVEKAIKASEAAPRG